MIQRPVGFSKETVALIADGDRLETVARLLKDALANTLRVIAWPESGEARKWQEQSAASRLAASRVAATVQHPRRMSGIRVDWIYARALGVIRNEYQIAMVHAPRSPQARLPQAVPPACTATLRQLLDADDLAMLLTPP